jgi:hypothetical protein
MLKAGQQSARTSAHLLPVDVAQQSGKVLSLLPEHTDQLLIFRILPLRELLENKGSTGAPTS